MTNNKSFKIFNLTERVYLLLFEDSYDLAMHFLRYQEYYESPVFKNTSFSIIEFMEWYAKANGKGAFTYPTDWGGYNIPSNVIWNVHSGVIPDHNKYDAAMLKVYNTLCNKEKGSDFYLIGCAKHNLGTVAHELSHALYFTNPSYREEMACCRQKLPIKTLTKATSWLKKIGYHTSVFEDELAAYFATGLPSDLKSEQAHTNKFESVYTNYTKKIAVDLSKYSPLQL